MRLERIIADGTKIRLMPRYNRTKDFECTRNSSILSLPKLLSIARFPRPRKVVVELFPKIWMDF